MGCEMIFSWDLVSFLVFVSFPGADTSALIMVLRDHTDTHTHTGLHLTASDKTDYRMPRPSATRLPLASSTSYVPKTRLYIWVQTSPTPSLSASVYTPSTISWPRPTRSLPNSPECWPEVDHVKIKGLISLIPFSIFHFTLLIFSFIL